MNLFYSAAAVLFCTASGFYFSKKLKEREERLCSVLMLVKELSVQIRYTNAKIGDMLKSASQNSAYGKLSFVTECALLNENEDFHRVWSEGVKKQPFLDQRDRELLLSLGEHLGETDSEGQLSFLEMTESMLSEQREEKKRYVSFRRASLRSCGGDNSALIIERGTFYGCGFNISDSRHRDSSSRSQYAASAVGT